MVEKVSPNKKCWSWTCSERSTKIYSETLQ